MVWQSCLLGIITYLTGGYRSTARRRSVKEGEASHIEWKPVYKSGFTIRDGKLHGSSSLRKQWDGGRGGVIESKNTPEVSACHQAQHTMYSQPANPRASPLAGREKKNVTNPSSVRPSVGERGEGERPSAVAPFMPLCCVREAVGTGTRQRQLMP